MSEGNGNGRIEAIGTDTFSARDPEAAIEQGLEALGLERDIVEITVIDRGSRGFLGIGARDARVRIEPRARVASAVRAMAGEILRLMGIEGSVTAIQEGQTVRVHIDSGKTDGLLIGRKGETLNALEHVLHRMTVRQTGLGEAARIEVDIAGYRERREEQIRKMAIELAERVERTGRRAMTEPLTGAERRIVHRVLADNGRVQTHAAGNGLNRRVVIAPPRRRGRTAAP